MMDKEILRYKGRMLDEYIPIGLQFVIINDLLCSYQVIIMTWTSHTMRVTRRRSKPT